MNCLKYRKSSNESLEDSLKKKTKDLQRIEEKYRMVGEQAIDTI